MAQRLSDQLVRRLPPPAKGNVITYDADVKGFGCRVTMAGARSFILNYRRKLDGLERRYTIGQWPDWSVSGAREEAKRLKRTIDGGGDPVGEDRAMRDAPTVSDLAERFEREHIAKQAAPTQRDYRSILRNDILPALGKRKIAVVDTADIERLHAAVSRRAPVRANRALAVVGKMFTLAVKWKLRSDSPTRGVQKNREHQRRRYLKPDELARLTEALATDPNQDVADALRLLLLTGARKGEVINARWDQFDISTGKWTKPHTATKQKREHTVPLSAPARALLAARLQRRDASSPWVFPGRNGARDDLKAWPRICKAAGLTDLHIHDLRHTYASQLASAGFSLPVIGALLGHTQPQTTARYAHLFDDPLREATERVGAIIAGEQNAEILPLNKRGRR
jgi:integrase